MSHPPAGAAALRPIADVAAELALGGDDLELHGRWQAKVRPQDRPSSTGAASPGAGSTGPAAAGDPARAGRYVLVTGMTPTASGEGKTVTSIGLGMALRQLGKRTTVTLRQSSLGPTLGRKGGGAGGGRARIEPLEGALLGLGADLFALESANNLLAAWADARIDRFGPDALIWQRAMDMNDRALRRIVVHPDGKRESTGRATGFDVTAASEVMAILSLARDLGDLRARLGRIVVGFDGAGAAVTAEDLGAAGAMAVLLRDALAPNLFQHSEGGPAFVHGGPFANIAHGCSSVIADLVALPRSDYVVTEAGFGADLGAEKFLGIKVPVLGRAPDAAVVVATVRALDAHGAALGAQGGLARLTAGAANLARHIANLAAWGLPVVVAVNRFPDDDPGHVDAACRAALDAGATAAVPHDGFAEGGAGCLALAEAVEAASAAGSRFRPRNPPGRGVAEQVETIATEAFGAASVRWDPTAADGLARITAAGFGELPVCIAKTHLSFSHDASLAGAPSGYELPIRSVRLAAGAGFVTVYAGPILTMPGLDDHPRFLGLDLAADGSILGLA